MPGISTARSLIAGTTGTLPEVINPLQQWLDWLELQNKEEDLLELEMWIRCFDRFFRIRNHPLTQQEVRDVVRRDFTEELKIVRTVSLRMSNLCSEILTVERTESFNFTHYIESQLKRDDTMSGFAESLVGQLTPEDSLALLIETLADLRSIIDGLVHLPSVSFQAFTSIGKILNREIRRCRFIGPLLQYKFKPHYDRIENTGITSIIRGIHSTMLRQDVATVFLEIFRMLRYLRLIERDLVDDRPLKKSLLIFSLIHSEGRTLTDFIERKLLPSPDLQPDSRDAVDCASYAMTMEFNKVYGHELVGFLQLRQAPLIYARAENSHGLLRNCLQQTVVGAAAAFDPEFNGQTLFDTMQTRFSQSFKLRDDIWRVISFLRHYETRPDKSAIAPLIDTLASFRDGALKLLMYKDWEQYEQFHEEILISCSREELAQVLHRFATYMETLLGQVNLRSVLANHPFEYPKIPLPE
ncbi:MAG: hypothetical protein ACKV2V_07565 [Blastocatellia bacterium]